VLKSLERLFIPDTRAAFSPLHSDTIKVCRDSVYQSAVLIMHCLGSVTSAKK